MGPFSAQIQRFARSIGVVSGGGGFAPFVDPAQSQRMSVGGLIAQVLVPVANGADTNYVFMPLLTIPAGLMKTNGDRLLIYEQLTLSAAVSSRTYQTNIGYTATGAAGFTGGTSIHINATTVASNDIYLRASIIRLSATQMAYWAENQFGSGVVQTQQYTTGSLTWANAQALAIGFKDGTGNAAALTAQYAEVYYQPAVVAA